MGSKIALKNLQDQEFSILHNDNAGAIAIPSNELLFRGFKNYIINGKKVVNQRSLTSTDNSYNQDRWYKAGNNWFQGIEGDNNLVSGKKFTLSWTGAATAGYYIGTATSSTINAQTFTPIANGGNFTLTISAGQNLWIKFASDASGSTFNFVQLEEGTVATPFENRPVGLELSLCQRYFEYGLVDEFYNYSGAVTNIGTGTKYKNTKRVVPTITLTYGTLQQNRIDGFAMYGNISIGVWLIDVIFTASAEL